MSDLEQELSESLAFALESGKMGTWDINIAANTVKCSPEMLRIWGMNPEDFNGDRALLQAKVHPDDRQMMIGAINDAINEQRIYEFEYRIFPAPGQLRWVLSRGRCTFASGSRVPVRFAGIVYDITDRKMKEEAQAAAAHVRDQFFMIASHELRTPLTCLQLQIDVLNVEIRENFPQALENQIVNTGLRKQYEHLFRVSHIVENILQAAKFSVTPELILNYTKMDLQEFVSEVLDRFRLAAENAGVRIIFSKDVPVNGRWDRFRLEQVILNLLTNGVKYGNSSPLTVEVRAEAERAIISVRDHGIGIRPEDQKRIFDRFERIPTSKKITGMGLGLYIANYIVSSHGGEIQVQSELGKGSEFKVLLPL